MMNTDDLIQKKISIAVHKSQNLQQSIVVSVIALFFIIIIGLSEIFFSFSRQFESSQALITEQFHSLDNQLLEKNLLIETEQQINQIIKNSNVKELPNLQDELFHYSKKLSLLSSEYKHDYLKFMSMNKLAIKLVSLIVSSTEKNERLKSTAIAQLNISLDRINIQLHNENAALIQQLLSKLATQVSDIIVTLTYLNLKTPLATFEQLTLQIDQMLVMNYAQELIEAQSSNQDIVILAEELIQLQQMALKESLLGNWQEQPYLIGDYEQKLIIQQQELHVIFIALFNKPEQGYSTLFEQHNENNKPLSFMGLFPLWFAAVFVFIVVGLCVFILRKVKVLTQLKEQQVSHIIKNDVVEKKKITTAKIPIMAPIKQQETVNDDKYCEDSKINIAAFNVDRYMMNQGTAELAIYMFREYTEENTVLITKLNYFFTLGHVESVKKAINSLSINSKILAASNLIKCCHQWQVLLTAGALDNSDASQVNLLAKTKKAIDEINEYANTFDYLTITNESLFEYEPTSIA